MPGLAPGGDESCDGNQRYAEPDRDRRHQPLVNHAKPVANRMLTYSSDPALKREQSGRYSAIAPQPESRLPKARSTTNASHFNGTLTDNTQSGIIVASDASAPT